MNSNQGKDDKSARLERIREIVMEDYQRIMQAATPFQILNVFETDSLEVVEGRFDKYERFYRAENFQRLGDIELTRKALDIRRALGRAIEQLRAVPQYRDKRDHQKITHDDSLFPFDENKAALGDIYFRDAMTFIQLGDLDEAYMFLKRSVDLDQRRALALAYLGYLTFKRRAFIANALDQARVLLDRAAAMDPEDCDIFVLRGRYFARLGELDALKQTINHIEALDPTHPMLDKLQKKVHSLHQ